jgi:hypothetical protein
VAVRVENGSLDHCRPRDIILLSLEIVGGLDLIHEKWNVLRRQTIRSVNTELGWEEDFRMVKASPGTMLEILFKWPQTIVE